MSQSMINLKIQGDNEGFVTFSCPYCHFGFKLQAGEIQNEENPVNDLFCPYCGLTRGKLSFLSDEIIETAKLLALNDAIQKIDKSFKKLSRAVNSTKSGIRVVTSKSLKSIEVKELKEKDSSEVEFKCGLYNRHVKVLYCDGSSKIFCPYCGVDI